VSVAGKVRQGRGAVTAQLGAPLLLCALSVALLAQGAYYLRAQLYVAALIGAALVVSPGLTRLASSDRAIAFPVGGLAGWAVIDAAMHHNPRAALPYVVLLAGVVAVLLACSRLDEAGRDLLLAGLIACGVLIAVVGWLGLTLHFARWTWQGQGLWRASSTLTYPNATAVILAMLALLTLALLTEAPRSVPLLLAATVVLTGLVATLSRAGLLALAVGVLVLGAFLGPRVLLRAGGAPMLGAAVAAIGLVPAMTTRTPHPAAALLALVAGLLISAALPAIRLPRAAINGLALLMLVLGVTTLHTAIGAISDARLTVDDPERAASFQAAVEVFIHHPVTGAGPSLPTLTWASGNGSSVYRYAHNEYLQVLAELGTIGGLLLAGLLLMIIRRLYHARRGNAAVAAGAVAATAALAVHAGFDFIWHIPAIPLLAAALVGLASPDVPAPFTQQAGETPGKESA
jgi:O-antigen ligase